MRLSNLYPALRLLIIKNKTILGDPLRSACDNRVNLDWWHPASSAKDNLGDCLSPDIVEWMLARKGLTLSDEVAGTKFLAAVGSILQTGLNDCTVWGSGLIEGGKSSLIVPFVKRMDIRAVRGPRTAEVLRGRGYRCPEIYGDPAILTPLMYNPHERKRSGVLYASHFKDRALFADDVFSMQTADWKSYVDAVVASELVVTTSLHGIILAECFGTPAVLVASDRDDYSPFKYEDWYYSTGRKVFPVASTPHEAIALEAAPLPDLCLLSGMRQGLLGSFPYDLWE